MSDVESFESSLSGDLLELLLDTGTQYEFDPTSSPEMEAFLSQLALAYNGDPAQFSL